MNLDIDFIDEVGEISEHDNQLIQNLLQFAAKVEGVEEGTELSISFVDNKRIQEVNREYRNKDYATDVISFAMEELGEGEMEIIGLNLPPMLGDIIISIPKAKEQAAEYGHTLQRELGFLALHGFLHLLGYDHETSEDEVKMFSKQREILDAYGLGR